MAPVAVSPLAIQTILFSGSLIYFTILFESFEGSKLSFIILPFDKLYLWQLLLLIIVKQKILSFIHDNIDNHNILICCYDGKSISPFIVALYIAEYSKIDKKSIYNILLTKDSNLSLWYDLSLFYSY